VLVLVRHGESSANASGLLLGRSDVELTALGRSQASAVRTLLGPVRELRSSSLRRARQTAALLEVAPEATIDDRWIEVDYGEHEGKPLSEVPAEVWQAWRADPTFTPAGGESLAEVGERVRDACDELFAEAGSGARADDGDVVVVSHVSPIKAAVAWALSTEGLDWRLHLSTGSVTRIGWGHRAPVLHSFNEVPSAELHAASGPRA
jgi:broad specificity phosphatase PhoE